MELLKLALHLRVVRSLDFYCGIFPQMDVHSGSILAVYGVLLRVLICIRLPEVNK